MADPREDLVVNISESVTGDGKPQAAEPAGAKERAKAWLAAKPRNKWIAGGSLAALLLVPLVAIPAAVASQKNNSGNKRMRVPSWGAYSGSGSKSVYVDPLGNPDSGVSGGMSEYKLPPGMKIPNFGSLAEANATIKVPKGGRKRAANGTIPKFGSEVVSPFVRVEGDQFDKDCRPFYPTGFNAFELFILAAEGNKEAVDDAFKQARMMGMTAARTWGHSITQAFPFQTAPGQYDPKGLAALDYVLDSASRHGIQLILSFVDNWKYYNGVAQFVDWCGPGRTMERPVDAGGDTDDTKWGPDQKRYEAGRHALFFSEPKCISMFQDHVKFMVNRKNSINGRVYKADPTILSWNVVNEPRCEVWVTPDCPARLNAWYSTMASFIKAQDPNHLVSSGSEGFFGGDGEWAGKNPGSWATQTGQDFMSNSADMDFAVAHAWPDNWMIAPDQQSGFLQQWLQSHLDAAKSIGKPLLFEEFGKRLDNPDDAAGVASMRDPVYRSTYAAIEAAVEDNEPLLGSMYWKWAFPTASSVAGGKGPYGVMPSDSTMKVIRDHSAKMFKLKDSVPPRVSCIAPPGAAANAPGALGAWFGAGTKCVNDPQAALAWEMLYGPGADETAKAADFDFPAASLERAKALGAGLKQVFPTQAACCAPQTGAFTGGCA
ncbi:MAG: glycoside hydrolase superfamily [Monoraphidium minutum]|nr:MAG: glycoside hydrolase superfamily [Monoraphidium minutum]